MISTSMKLLVLVLYASSSAVNALETYGVQELCGRQSTGTLILENPNWGTVSSAILVASKFSILTSDKNCSVLIQSKNNVSGIVISVRKIELRPDDIDTLKIRYVDEGKNEHEKIYRNWKTDYQNDVSERKSYISVRNVTITFNTGSFALSTSEGFEFTVTTITDVYDTSQFRCRNGLYIAKELKCDGHNHCGDRSDQEDCRSDEEVTTSNSSNSNALTISLVVLGIVGVVGFLISCAYFNKCDCDTSDCDCDSMGSSSSRTYGMRAASANVQTSSYTGRSAGYTSSSYVGGSAGYTSSSTYSGGSAGSCYSGGGTYAGGAAGTCG